MAEIRIQTGWGEELSAQAYECLQLIREASSMLASLNLDSGPEVGSRNTFLSAEAYKRSGRNRRQNEKGRQLFRTQHAEI